MASSSDLPSSPVSNLLPPSPNLSSLSPLSPNLSFLISNLKSLISVKLDPTNYTVWRSQFENILRAYDLYKYVDGSHPCPSPDLVDSTGNLIFETPIRTWMMTNAHLLSCLTTTLTDPLKSFVLNMRNASDVWSVLEKRFTRLSRSHIHKLKDSLNNMTKGADNMETYLEKIKEVAEKLEVASAPISDEDLVYVTLNGLPLEYLPIKSNIRARESPITLEDLGDLLCSEEIHMLKEFKSTPSHDQAVAFAAFRGGAMYNRGGPSNRSFYNRGRGGFRNSYNRGRGVFRGNFRGGGRLNGGRHGNNASQDLQPQQHQQRWFVDSGATDHLTNDLNNLQIHKPYQGTDQITVGDGRTLPIENIGQIYETGSFSGTA